MKKNSYSTSKECNWSDDHWRTDIFEETTEISLHVQQNRMVEKNQSNLVAIGMERKDGKIA